MKHKYFVIFLVVIAISIFSASSTFARTEKKILQLHNVVISNVLKVNNKTQFIITDENSVARTMNVNENCLTLLNFFAEDTKVDINIRRNRVSYGKKAFYYDGTNYFDSVKDIRPTTE